MTNIISFIRPEFFDIFGIIIFAFIFILSLRELKTDRFFSKKAVIALLIIGIVGFFVDCFSVYLNYLK